MGSQKSLFNAKIGNLFSEIPANKKSHVRGWTQHWADTIQENPEILVKNELLDEVDIFYFDHGVNSEPGQMNLFNGIPDETAERIISFVENKGAVCVSLDTKMPIKQYVEGLKKRVGQSSCSKLITESLVDDFEQKLKIDAEMCLTQEDFIKSRKTFCIGDSHSTSYAAPGQPVLRTNGLTLHGALRKQVFEQAAETHSKYTKSMTIVAGSIDIRHHVGLKPDPLESVRNLVESLVGRAIYIQDEFDIEVELCVPVPVEFEERRIPKTGWLNGRPFTGSLHQRQDWTKEFRDTLIEEWGCIGKILSPPTEWYNMDPEEYAKEHMELASSFHISPVDYRRHGGWEHV